MAQDRACSKDIKAVYTSKEKAKGYLAEVSEDIIHFNLDIWDN